MVNLAQDLLRSSYGLSVRRISEALDGALTIRNSRKPIAPSQVGEVIGLCGQGGRHPYFRIPVAVVRQAIADIASANSVEAIAAACQILRRQTIFDDRTRCTNDQLPAIVPLLPPEEIWCDGFELPLDVWRLLSFDIDLVASALSAQVPLDDIAFGSLTQSGLAFRAVMGRMQTQSLELTITPRDLPTSFSTSLTGGPRKLSMTLARLFFEAGCLLTPLRLSDITQWYAALRYQDWIAMKAPRLCVRDEFRRESVDSRYRGLFAEEMAIGIMAVVLADIFDARPIVNTAEFLAANDPGALRKGVPVADFIATARGRYTIIAESKGSLGTNVANGRIRRAKEQVAATRLRMRKTAAKLPLVFCSSVFFSYQQKDASCLVIDPPADAGDDDLIINPIDPILAWRAAYAKVFRFVGLDTASQQVLHGERISSLFPMDVRPVDDRLGTSDRWHRAAMARERFGADLLLDVGSCAVGIDPQVLKLLRESGVHERADEALEHFAENRHKVQRFRGSSSFLNCLGIGCIFYDDLTRK